MSASVASEALFLSALQPSNTLVSTYALPSEVQLEHGGSLSDEAARARRVQQQVQMRLAEKSVSSTTLPRMNGNATNYASSEYGGVSSVKYATYNPGFSSRSHMYTVNRTMPAPRMSQYSGGFSSRSAVDFGPRIRPSRVGVAGDMGRGVAMDMGRGVAMDMGRGVAMDMGRGVAMDMGRGVAGVGVYHDDIPMAGYQTSARHQVMTRTMSRPDPETLSLHSMRLYNMAQQPGPMASWMTQDGSDGSDGSAASDHDAAPYQPAAYASNSSYSSQVRQTAGLVSAPSTMRRSLSGTLAHAAMAGSAGGGAYEVVQQHSFKGPAFRTISRINNRNNRLSIGSMSGGGTLQHQMSMTGSAYGGSSSGRLAMGQMVGSSQGSMTLQQQRQASVSRAMSVKSLHSVGRGMDVIDGWKDMAGSMGNLSGINNLDMTTAVSYLLTGDPDMQVLGAAYIQHECYHNTEAKNQVRQQRAIHALVQLFNSENQEVQRYATGAMRNIIYENMENKAALIDAGGIPQLVQALKESDDELRKNITGILWNLSSKDSLKEKLAKEILPELTEKILIPLSSSESEVIQHNPSEVDIFYNTTGCLRNLSSINEKTRQQMRETRGLVDSLVSFLQRSIEDGRVEDKGVENSMCVLRNLSYQLYSEMPPSVLLRLEGPTRGKDGQSNDAIGCFTPQSKKAKDRKNQELSTFSEVAKQPKDQERLWHPQAVALYNRVLQRCELNSVTREAAAGALQNITAGDKRWASVLSRVALEQERMLPVLLDSLRTQSDTELRSVTGFFRNLSRHSRNKGDMATKVVSNLIPKLPDDGYQKEPSSDVVVNICGTLNNLVTGSQLAARDITFFDGIKKLVGIKNSHDNSPAKAKAAKAAATVLCNMFQYKKLHKDYKQKGFTRQDFTDITI